MNASLSGEVILLYAYWEPVDGCDFQECRQHRDEIADLQTRLRGAKPILRSSTYQQIWRGWATEGGEPWLKTHVDRLRQRYEVVI